MSAVSPYDEAVPLTSTNTISALVTAEDDYYTNTATGDALETRKVADRERVVYGLLQMIDYYQWKFESDLAGRASGIETGADLLSGALSVAATASPQGDISRILSALSASFTAGKVAFMKNFLDSNSASLLVGKMHQLQTAKYATIVPLMHTNTSTYPLGQALIDVDAYAKAGTVMSAISAMAQDTGTAQSNADSALSSAELSPTNKVTASSTSAR